MFTTTAVNLYDRMSEKGEKGGEQGMKKAIAVLLLAAMISVIAVGPIDANNGKEAYAPGQEILNTNPGQADTTGPGHDTIPGNDDDGYAGNYGQDVASL